eukprot:gene3789-13857_t
MIAGSSSNSSNSYQDTAPGRTVPGQYSWLVIRNLAVRTSSRVSHVFSVKREASKQMSRESDFSAPATLSTETCSGPPESYECGVDLSDDFVLGNVGQKLQSLRLRSQAPEIHEALDAALEALSDVIKTPLGLDLGEQNSSSEDESEAKMWCCFGKVYELETKRLQSVASSPMSTMKKRQILADILVWAEVTAPGYDKVAASFITGPHSGDESFQRIGKLLAEAKAGVGLESACSDSL